MIGSAAGAKNSLKMFPNGKFRVKSAFFGACGGPIIITDNEFAIVIILRF